MKSKAIFLLVIFLLNTIVGFGCALGIEEKHHDDKDHSHGKLTDHEHHGHEHSSRHEHKKPQTIDQDSQKGESCCKTLVNDLVTQGKLVPESGKLQVVMPIIWLSDYSLDLLTPVIDLETHNGIYIAQREKPPNRDIRIVIQSFQI